jgi:lambda repressor-like predicted transcriptional regulator
MHGSERMDPELIKANLRIAGSSVATIARELGVSVAAVSKTIRYSNCRSRRIESAVADALNLAPSAIWPARYERASVGSPNQAA